MRLASTCMYGYAHIGHDAKFIYISGKRGTKSIYTCKISPAGDGTKNDNKQSVILEGKTGGTSEGNQKGGERLDGTSTTQTSQPYLSAIHRW